MKRKIIIQKIESGKVNNARLIEHLAEKFKERSVENGGA